MNNSNDYLNPKRNLDRIPKYTLVGLVITLTVMVVLMPSFIKKLRGSIYNIKSTGAEGVVIESPKKVLLGDSSGNENYKGAAIYNRDNFVINIRNNSEYEMTGISLSMTGTGELNGKNFVCQEGFYSRLSSKEAEAIKCEGVVKDAYGYKDVSETMTISYTLNEQSYTETLDAISFYHKVPELNITNVPIKNSSSVEYTYAYSGGTNEDFYVSFPISSIYLDKSENLEDLNIRPQYKSSFGNNIKVEHPQSSDTDSHFGGVTPRLYDYLSYTKAGSGSYNQLDTKGSFVELQHILKGTPTTVTNTPVKVYVPIRAHYIKSGWNGYDRATNDTSYFSISDQPSIQLTI